MTKFLFLAELDRLKLMEIAYWDHESVRDIIGSCSIGALMYVSIQIVLKSEINRLDLCVSTVASHFSGITLVISLHEYKIYI